MVKMYKKINKKEVELLNFHKKYDRIAKTK